MIKSLIAYPLSWFFYWIGDTISRNKYMMNWAWPWPIYQGVMLYSIQLQEWAAKSKIEWPWEDTHGDQA